MTRSFSRTMATIAMAATFLAATPAAQPEAPLQVSNTPESVEGRGIWAKTQCILCVATFVGASGGTVAGAIAVGSLFPEYVAACGLTCILAYT